MQKLFLISQPRQSDLNKIDYTLVILRYAQNDRGIHMFILDDNN